MPLPPPAERDEIHSRFIDMRAFVRRDGLYDVEGHLLDRKPFDFVRVGTTWAVPAGAPFHDLWIRMTVDGGFILRAIEVASDVTPWPICKETQSSLSVLVGETLERGWSAKVRERLRGPASCTHLAEMLLPLATTALQGIQGFKPLEERYKWAELLVDSCHAFDRGREIVERVAPMHYRPRDSG